MAARANAISGITRSAWSRPWEVDTPIVYEIPEPGAVVYRWGGDPETFYGVRASGLNLPQRALGNESYTLTLSNLPLHSGVSVWMSANAINTDPPPDLDTVELSVAGRTARSTTDFGPNPPRPPINMAIENVVHTDQTLTLTLSGSGFEAGTFPSGSDGWELWGLEVTLLAPAEVSIARSQESVWEGQSGQFIVSLSKAVGGSIAVPVYFGGSDMYRAAENEADYMARPSSSVVIPAGDTSATITIDALADAVCENTEEVVATLGTPLGPAKLGQPVMATLLLEELMKRDLAPMQKAQLEQKIYLAIIDRSLERAGHTQLTEQEPAGTKGPRSGANLLQGQGAAAVDFGVGILKAAAGAVAKLVGGAVEKLAEYAGRFEEIEPHVRDTIIDAINRNFITFAKSAQTPAEGKNHRSDIVWTVDRCSGELRGTISGITGTVVAPDGRILEGDNVPYSVYFEGDVEFDEDNNVTDVTVYFN